MWVRVDEDAKFHDAVAKSARPREREWWWWWGGGKGATQQVETVRDESGARSDTRSRDGELKAYT